MLISSRGKNKTFLFPQSPLKDNTLKTKSQRQVHTTIFKNYFPQFPPTLDSHDKSVFFNAHFLTTVLIFPSIKN
ncbi:MAG: hypothetical protein CRN43_18730 [Candidatus Nephrothrix sp. EaCA]|nr:MAG: hypothetical protein CRN43_18730 [Candidatus Nephrothrix sp. EaCA]